MAVNNMLLHNLINGLNPPQRQAVTHSYDMNTLVVAGAGSGKTGVLTRRIAFIIGCGYSTDSILAVTFTNKAADEMRKRVGKYIGDDNAKKILMGTFHSICVEILRKFGKEVGVPRYFTIYDANDAKQLMKEVVSEITGSIDKETVDMCCSGISNMKNNLITITECQITAATQQERLISLAYEKYQHKLNVNKSLDFDDLIMKTVLLLRHSTTARNYCQNRFKFVLGKCRPSISVMRWITTPLIAGKPNTV